MPYIRDTYGSRDSLITGQSTPSTPGALCTT